MQLSDQKDWSQDPPLPSPHLRVGSGGKDIFLEFSTYLSLSKGKQIYLFVYFSLFLHLWLLHLDLFSFAVAKVIATLLLLLYFPSHYSVTNIMMHRIGQHLPN